MGGGFYAATEQNARRGGRRSDRDRARTRSVATQERNADARSDGGDAATAEGEGLPPDGHAQTDHARAERQGGTTQARPAAAGREGRHAISPAAAPTDCRQASASRPPQA